MKIMSINSGSSSLKFKLFEMPEELVICEGQFERITMKEIGSYTMKYKGEKIVTPIDLPDHSVAVETLLKDLIDKKIISSLEEIKGVGHRIVQGGKYFKESSLVTDWSKDRIRELIDLAPLHNQPHLVGIEAFEKHLKDVKQVVVFDTAFHQTMEEEAFMYAVPYYWYEKYGIRKYGAHGTSHMYVSREYGRLANVDITKKKIVTCHIGNGASLCAIENGKCKDTSMGLTPLEGIPMGTRTGNIDPTVVSYIAEKENKSAKEVVNELNKKSGYLGVSEISNDARDLEEAYEKGDQKAKLALDIQEKRIADYIGSYYVYLQGIDTIIFTAGIGENSKEMRERTLKRLEFLGVKIDPKLNNDRGHSFKISTPDSKIEVWVIPTNEELVIARDTLRLISK